MKADHFSGRSHLLSLGIRSQLCNTGTTFLIRFQDGGTTLCRPRCHCQSVDAQTDTADKVFDLLGARYLLVRHC